MRKLQLLAAFAAVVIVATSCMQECEVNDTGDVTVTNSSNSNLYFDVRTGDIMNEPIQLSPGAASTVTVTSGSISVWASESSSSNYVKLTDLNVNQCGSASYTNTKDACAIYEYTDVTVTNNSGWIAYVDAYVYGGPGYLGEVMVYDGDSHTWENVSIGSGSLDFYYERWVDGQYTWSSIYDFSACTPFTFTWNAKNAVELKVGGDNDKDAVREL